MKISIFTLGGTIDKIYFDDLSNYEVGEPQISEILKVSQCKIDFEINEVVRKDSLHLTDADRLLLKQQIEATKNRFILVTHGTDSMVETARTLKDIPDKVIVFTGAISPYRFRSSDAAFNVGCAVAALQILPPGIFITMSGRVFPYDKVRKNRAAGAFEDVSADE